MTDDRDIWRAATLLMERYGDDAPMEAAQRANDSFNRDDADSYGIWLRIFAAVAELARTNRADGERVN